MPISDSSLVQPSKPPNWHKRFVQAVALTILGTLALLQISKWPLRLRYPGEEDAAEGTQLSEMVHLRRGIQIYRVPAGGEFDGGIYGPLCYLVGAAIINPEQPSYLPLRLLSLTATLNIAILSGLFVFRLTKSRAGAAFAVLIFFANAYVGRYGISARADMVALFLSFAGFLVLFDRPYSRRTLFLSVGLILCGVFYKQQFVGAPIAIFVYLLLSRRLRAAVEFSGMMAAGALLFLAAFSYVVFPHQAFLTHFITYNHLPFRKDLILPEILMFVIPLFVPLLAGADYLDHHPQKIVTCYAIIASAVYFALLFSSGSGADTNRCLEAVVILSCLAAARIGTSETVIGSFAWLASLTFTFVIVSLLSSAFVVPRITAQDFKTDAAVQSYLRQTFPQATSALTYYAGDPLRAGLQVPITNLWHYSALLRKRVISDRDIVNRIERGGYGVILLDFNLASAPVDSADFYTTASMRDAILRHYELRTRLELPTPELTRFNEKTVYIWVPKGTGVAGATS